MKSKMLLTIAAAAMLSLTGCQSGSSNTAAANEELLQQIEQLQQQVQDLEEKITSEENAAPENIPPATGDSADAGTGEQEAAPAVSPDPEASALSGSESSAGIDSTTRTIEELTDTVSAFETKVDSIVPASSSSESMEQFLTLKQEEKKIDDELDLHEDELEALYRQGTLSRDDYKARERELERLEDRLDDAEDKLEDTFGIDD